VAIESAITPIKGFHQALRTQIGQGFPLAEAPGPGVMRVQVAITDLQAATPGLRTIATIIPQARALNTLKYAATGTYAFIGAGSLEAAAQWKWGDAENALTKMATVTAERLKAWTSGKQPPK
jgi:hypothetical protein